MTVTVTVTAAAPRQSFALDVAAPSLRHDRDAPWTGSPGAHGEAGLAAMFWISFHGLSAFIHAVLITLSVAGPMLLAVVPIPFIAAMCSEVRPVDKPIERVEMAIVEIPPPPPEPEVVHPASQDTEIAQAVDKIVLPAKKKKRAAPEMVELKMVALLEAQNAGVLGALSSSDSGAFASLTASGFDDNVLGGLVGSSVGDSFGTGGLGLRGVGEGGGGRGEGIGLGSIGTIGTGRLGAGGGGGGTGSGYGSGSGRLGGTRDRDVKKVRVALDDASPASRARLQRMLALCDLAATHTGTIVVQDGAVKSVKMAPANACATRQLQRALFDADGTKAFTIEPVTPN